MPACPAFVCAAITPCPNLQCPACHATRWPQAPPHPTCEEAAACDVIAGGWWLGVLLGVAMWLAAASRPDGDGYIEDFWACGNPDFSEIVGEPRQGRTPIDVGDDETSSFVAFSWGRELDWVQELDWVFVERLLSDQEAVDYFSWLLPAASCSCARVLGVQFTRREDGQRRWCDVVWKIVEVDLEDWPMPGSGTERWCAQFRGSRKVGPMWPRSWWESNFKLNATDSGVHERDPGMRASQSLGEYDQVDLGQCRVIGFHYEKKSRGGKRQNEEMRCPLASAEGGASAVNPTSPTLSCPGNFKVYSEL